MLVAHPLLGFVAKKQKDYYSEEIVEIPIYDGSQVMRWSTHTFTDFLNPYLLEHFTLEKLIEQTSTNKSNENNFSETVPDYLVMKLVKNSL